MNNDLSELSEKELRQKSADCLEVEEALNILDRQLTSKYNKLIMRRWTNPLDLIKLGQDLTINRKACDLILEYSRTLTDEYNRRIEEENKNS
jgi:hypothetical protein